jgi:putative ABC transport system permease protein
VRRTRFPTLLFILSSAWHALGRHRLRAGLTMLGISIGIGAVVTMVSFGEGAHRLVVERLERMGSNMLFIEAGNRTTQGVRTAFDTMTYEDVLAVRQECDEVAEASPHVDFDCQVSFGNQNWRSQAKGIDPSYQRIRNWDLAEGEFLTEEQCTSAAKVAVLGQTVLKKIFPTSVNPIGQTIRVAGVPFRVVGVMTSKGTSVTGSDQDDFVVIPWTTAQHRMLGIKHIKDMYLSAVSRESIGAAKKQVTALLRQRHRLVTPDQPDDFTIRDYTEVADQVDETNRVMTLLLSTIAAIALVVGGINTMSIMLVIVAERTREIGVRMAVGARAGHVRLQFLLEAALLTVIGGVAGILLGTASSQIVGSMLEWPAVVSPQAIIISLVVAASVGLIFGLYPAIHASRMDPIQALRDE